MNCHSRIKYITEFIYRACRGRSSQSCRVNTTIHFLLQIENMVFVKLLNCVLKLARFSITKFDTVEEISFQFVPGTRWSRTFLSVSLTLLMCRSAREGYKEDGSTLVFQILLYCSSQYFSSPTTLMELELNKTKLTAF